MKNSNPVSNEANSLISKPLHIVPMTKLSPIFRLELMSYFFPDRYLTIQPINHISRICEVPFAFFSRYLLEFWARNALGNI